MMVLILGGSASGKSAFAEEMADCLQRQQPSGKKIYLATMPPFDQETRERIERHRQSRAGKGFVTIEEYGLIGGSEPERQHELTIHDTVLLECLSNYMNNVYPSCQAEQIADSLLWLKGRCRHLVIVSNLIQADGRIYDAATREYLETFGLVNRRLAAEARQVYEVVCGLPLAWKT